MPGAGIYVHIPYCKVKCHYCDFHFSTNSSRADDMIEAICSEIRFRANELINFEIDTIYFGGGTPSLLSKSQIHQILKTIHESFRINPKVETTLECNPDDLTKENLSVFKSQGVNRLSIGIQSFDDDVLKLMNRAHNAKEALSSIQLAKEAGFENITIDLIYGVPEKGMDYWKEQIDIFLNLQVPHLSSYCLTIEPKTVFDKWTKMNKFSLPEDEMARNQFNHLRKTLIANHYDHYEISNFAKNGFISQHNTSYWLSKHYMGVGPSAHSYNGDERRWNIANNPQYMKLLKQGKTYFEVEKLSEKDKFNDYVLTRLRTKWGINLDEIEELGSTLDLNEFYSSLKRQIDAKYLIKNNGIVTLSEEGLFIADHISADLFI